jgi:hypothetical protein
MNDQVSLARPDPAHTGAGRVALENPGRERVPALAALATWRDLGAGAGPMLAGALLPLVPHPALYGGAALLLAASAIAVARQRKRRDGASGLKKLKN